MAWWSAWPGRWRGGTSGRSSAVDCGVRLIFEGLTSRPGLRRGSLSRSGRGRRLPVAHSSSREPRATVVGLLCARARPDSVAGALVGVCSVKGGGEGGGRGAGVGWGWPARVGAAGGAPSDLDDARVLACLAARELLADRG